MPKTANSEFLNLRILVFERLHEHRHGLSDPKRRQGHIVSNQRITIPLFHQPFHESAGNVMAILQPTEAPGRMNADGTIGGGKGLQQSRLGAAQLVGIPQGGHRLQAAWGMQARISDHGYHGRHQRLILTLTTADVARSTGAALPVLAAFLVVGAARALLPASTTQKLCSQGDIPVVLIFLGNRKRSLAHQDGRVLEAISDNREWVAAEFELELHHKADLFLANGGIAVLQEVFGGNQSLLVSEACEGINQLAFEKVNVIQCSTCLRNIETSHDPLSVRKIANDAASGFRSDAD